MKVPCIGCDISCCSEYSVLVNFLDVHRIGETLGLPVPDFAGFVPLVQENIDYDPYAFSLGGEEKFLLALKKKSKSCIFLMSFPSAGRCGIHACRPNVCRCYPFTFEHGRAEEAHQMLCPTGWDLEPEDEKKFAAAYQQLRADYFLYQAFIETWNADALAKTLQDKDLRINSRELFLRLLEFLRARLLEATSSTEGKRA